VLFGERLGALVAAVALKTVSVLSEALADGLARMAGHGGFPLVTTACLPDNDFAGSSRRKLWWILTPVSVDALAGVYWAYSMLAYVSMSRKMLTSI
jgi:hypothetical protein